MGFRVLVYLLTCAALPVLRRRPALPRASWRVPAGDLVATVSVLTCAALLVARPWPETRQLALAVGAGFVAYWLLGRRGSPAAA